MNRLDPEKVSKFEEKVLKSIAKFQKLFNAGKIRELKQMFGDNFMFVISRGNHHYQGGESVGSFLKRTRQDGLVKIELTVRKKKTFPLDFLLYENGAYAKYDMLCLVSGTYVFHKKHSGGKKSMTSTEGVFDWESGHQWTCPDWPISVRFD